MSDTCQRGHDLTVPENVKWREHSHGGYPFRECRACQRLRAAEQRARARWQAVHAAWARLLLSLQMDAAAPGGRTLAERRERCGL